MKTQQEFQAWAEEELKLLLSTLKRKGEAYTGQQAEALANFRARQFLLNTRPPMIIFSDMTKQLAAISRWLQDSPRSASYRELGVTDRLDDVIIYALLLRFCMEQEGGV